MKKLLLIGILAIAVMGQRPHTVPNISHGIHLCDNATYTTDHISSASAMMLSDGCSDVHFIYIGNDYWIGYGTSENKTGT